MKREYKTIFPFVIATVLAGGCVTTGTHQAVVDELASTRTEMQGTRENLQQTKDGLGKQTTKANECNQNLTGALDQNQQLVTKVASLGHNVEELLGQKGELAEDRKRLGEQVQELERLKSSAEARNAEFRQVMEKLQNMVDAGTLSVKIRGGRMVVQMSSDVIFSPGGTRIKAAAREAITSLADTISQFPNRKFQVVGHSDPTPIKTSRYPSNWELSSQRAIEVVKLMVDAGVPSEMLSASGSAEFDPLVNNESAENKAMNRRVEIVFLPKLDELPGFGNLLDPQATASNPAGSLTP